MPVHPCSPVHNFLFCDVPLNSQGLVPPQSLRLLRRERHLQQVLVAPTPTALKRLQWESL